VKVTWSVTDPESGLATSPGCDPTDVATETAGLTLTCVAVNGVGLSNTVSVTIKLDKTGPSASLAVATGAASGDGWFTDDVVVRTAGDDPVSGPVSCTPDQFQSVDTPGTVFRGECMNAAGLQTQASPLTVKVDKTPPNLTASRAPQANSRG
jgi:hypothetical protein